ncbi:hypothetical protein AB0M39_41395 [Streptomyces sp. NPDC051907]|uniref:hypothetical protein n=1 Tax=Streptomyces sp. NPDC051907 TaxID=3155284 RepID=UPI00342D51F0
MYWRLTLHGSDPAFHEDYDGDAQFLFLAEARLADMTAEATETTFTVTSQYAGLLGDLARQYMDGPTFERLTIEQVPDRSAQTEDGPTRGFVLPPGAIGCTMPDYAG